MHIARRGRRRVSRLDLAEIESYGDEYRVEYPRGRDVFVLDKLKHGLQIRHAAAGDMDAVRTLMLTWYRDNGVPVPDNLNGTWLVCLRDGRVCSCLLTQETPDGIGVLGLFSERDRWGKLAGDAIMRHLSAHADERRLGVFGVTSSAHIALFSERYGWKVAGIALVRPPGGASCPD